MDMSQFEKTKKNRVQRVPERGIYQRDIIYDIVDNALIGHVGFVVDGEPFVIPTLIARQEDQILVHGALSSRLMRHIQSGAPLCVAVTHVDGLVLARSIFHHSLNYRSAVLFGAGILIEDRDAKMEALRLFSERLIPGRWEDARQPNDVELKATAVASVEIDLASAKVRSGPPGEEEEDYSLPVWAGVLPIRQLFEDPIPDNRLDPAIDFPEYLQVFLASD
jgi:nitroimidazol reductase NimA-like FMN-containing flavoprotein (pyridoxamine 5'-phosphate oxidase superfamily)